MDALTCALIRLLRTALRAIICWLVQGPMQALTMTVVLPDSRRRSPCSFDVVLGLVDESALKVASAVVTTACVVPPNIALLAGECTHCPEGGDCPGAKRA